MTFWMPSSLSTFSSSLKLKWYCTGNEELCLRPNWTAMSNQDQSWRTLKISSWKQNCHTEDWILCNESFQSGSVKFSGNYFLLENLPGEMWQQGRDSSLFLWSLRWCWYTWCPSPRQSGPGGRWPWWEPRPPTQSRWPGWSRTDSGGCRAGRARWWRRGNHSAPARGFESIGISWLDHTDFNKLLLISCTNYFQKLTHMKNWRSRLNSIYN